MSKKKNKNKKKVQKKNIQKLAQDDREKVLRKMLECGNCSDAGDFKERGFDSATDRVDYCFENLPGFKKVEEQFINYIFSDGISAGGVSEDKKLDAFRFRLNEQDTTNNSVLRDAIKLAHCRYGECGIRWKDGNIYLYMAGTYAPLTATEDGITKVYAYIATKDGSKISESQYDIKDLSFGLDDIEEHFNKRGLIVLDPSEFVNLRNDTSKLHGAPPLERDKLRVDLLINVYERLNYDVTFDGPGRLLMPVKSGYINSEDNEVSTTEIIRQAGATLGSKNKDALDEIERIATDIKDSSSDAVIAVSDGFGTPIHLPRVTKASEFLEWLEKKEGKILADLIGFPPSLFEEGELSGNVSMTRIVDNAMMNSVIPSREHYANQFSPLISPKLGLQKTYFGEYVLQSEESPTQKLMKVATSMQQLNTIEDVPEVKEVIRTLAKMIDYAFHDSVGGVVELSEEKKEKKTWLKRIFGKRF